jgi:hypothetical protein
MSGLQQLLHHSNIGYGLARIDEWTASGILNTANQRGFNFLISEVIMINEDGAAPDPPSAGTPAPGGRAICLLQPHPGYRPA